MIDKLTQRLDFQGNALVLRAERQRAIASNIANADTPGYVARDFHFSSALKEATEGGSRLGSNQRLSLAPATHSGHVPMPTVDVGNARTSHSYSTLGYTVQTQPSLDNNTVDLDRERANFVDNSVRYEATLRFINGQSKTMLSAIQGQ